MKYNQIIPSKPPSKSYTNVQGFDITGGNETPYLVSDMEIEDKDKPYSIKGMLNIRPEVDQQNSDDFSPVTSKSS